MKRTDFLKTLWALVISPLAINSILKDNGCPTNRSYKDRERIADEDLKARMQYPLTYDECYPIYRVGNVVLLYNHAYMITSIENGYCNGYSFDNGIYCRFSCTDKLPIIYEPYKRTIPTRMS